MSTTFYEAPPWRFTICNLLGAQLTFLDRLASNRTVTLTLNDAATATADVPSDNPEINITALGIPFVSMGDKLLYGFRREAPDEGGPWVVRFAGILQQVNDEITVETDVPTTHLTAFDAWGFLKTMPILKSDGTLPGTSGVSYNGNTGNDIVIQLLNNAYLGIQSLLSTLGITGSTPLSAQNMFLNWGQSGLYPAGVGTIETTEAIDQVNFKQGSSIGDALTQLTQAGYLDIIMEPVYDQANQPGIVSQLNIFQTAGSQRPGAFFGWDRPGRSLVGMNRLQDGTKIANVGIGYAGQGGPAVQPAAVKSSIERYGPYWLQTQYSTDLASDANVESLMVAQVLLLQAGQQTLTIDVAPEVGPRPFLDYKLADWVPVLFSENFRQALSPVLVEASGSIPAYWTNFQRIYEIPFVIQDDGPETVTTLGLTPPLLDDTTSV